MRIRYCLIAPLLALLSWTSANAVTVQDPSWIMSDGSAFLWVEAETLLENVTPADTGFLIVDKVNPYITPAEDADGIEIPKGGIPALPPDTNALGGAGVLDLNGGTDTATYELQFTIPGRYFLYGHISLFNRNADTNYGSEDSIYVPPAFDKNSRDDWIGWEGLDELGDPKTGDSNRDGWMATPNNRVIIGEELPGDMLAHNTTDEDFWDGQFWWHLFDVTIDMDENDAYVDDFGHLLFYDVSEEDVGTTLQFEISSREAHGAHDGFLFATSDVLLLDTFNQEQLQAEMLNFFKLDASGLMAGDADQDLDFDQFDLIRVQQAAKYLTGQAATWGEGDWDGAPGGSPGNPPAGDGLFNQNDIVAALGPAHYLTGPYAAIKEGGALDDGQTSLVYDVSTGELSVDSPADKDLTSINVTSASGKFIGDKPSVLDGAFDNFAADNIFKATFGGSFGDISFGQVLPTGLSQADVASDLTAVGSLSGGGDLGDVDLVYVPEPASALMLLFAFVIGLSQVRQARR